MDVAAFRFAHSNRLTLSEVLHVVQRYFHNKSGCLHTDLVSARRELAHRSTWGAGVYWAPVGLWPRLFLAGSESSDALDPSNESQLWNVAVGLAAWYSRFWHLGEVEGR